MDRIGKYRIEAMIGRGGFSRVYRAFDPTVHRTVAIKVLEIGNGPDEAQLLTRFHAEATTTGTLVHRNIVTVYEYGEQDGLPYLVMEHLQGRDLEQILNSQTPMTLAERVSLMRQVADGLQHAHSRGIVHRDVKPANIMVLNDNTVKLMDFGIARLLREHSARMTQQGKLMGTLAYMSPEQLLGQDVDFLADVFAYGVIYYELIGGQHPFKSAKGGSDVASMILNVTMVDPPSLRAVAPECPPALEQIIFKAIHKDRAQRYQSFDDLQLDVTPILADLESKLAQQKVKEGERLFGAGKIQEARLVMREALRLAPANAEANALRRKIQQHVDSEALRRRCEQLLSDGHRELEAGNPRKAIDAVQALLRLDPAHEEAARLLSKTESRLREMEQANNLLDLAQKELDAGNLTIAGVAADQFLEKALALMSDPKGA